MVKAGKLDLAGMITDRYDLDHIDDAVANLRDRKGVRTALRIG
jgi:Zn-dependent alcohol dehydrogenase